VSGWDPADLTSWFHTNLVDGYNWVVVPTVVGMSQHADGGLMATKPYAARLGPDACPFTAGYWSFLDRHADRFARNLRMARQVQVVEQERHRGAGAP
jgi:deoxyribodipyrimidine photolyase-related protein